MFPQNNNPYSAEALAAWPSNEPLRNFSERFVRDVAEGKNQRTDVGVDGYKNAEEDQELDNVEGQQISSTQPFRAKSPHEIKNRVQRKATRKELTLPWVQVVANDSPAKRYEQHDTINESTGNGVNNL
jgi:hypothetical protein